MAVAKRPNPTDYYRKTTLPVWLMFTPFSKTASKIYCRSFWKPRWMQLWGYEKIVKVILRAIIRGMATLPKHSKASTGEFQIDVPRDRNGEFEPKLIPKYQRDISGIEEKVISRLCPRNEYKGYS